MTLSVERAERRFDADRLPEHSREGPSRGRALEAGQPPARVRTPSRLPRPVLERSVPRYEAHQLGPRSLAAAADACADGIGLHA
jgi:hypothetical protein